MAGLKVTLDAALRARDVSRPGPVHEEAAARALPEQLAVRRRPAESPGARPYAAVSQPPVPPPRSPQPVTAQSPKPAPASRGQEGGAMPGGSPRPEQPDKPQPRRPRTRRRRRLGRLADHGSGGSSPDFS